MIAYIFTDNLPDKIQYMSYWPIPGAYELSTLNLEYWSDSDEMFFLKWLDTIQENWKLLSGTEWSKQMKSGSKKSRVLWV